MLLFFKEWSGSFCIFSGEYSCTIWRWFWAKKSGKSFYSLQLVWNLRLVLICSAIICNFFIRLLLVYFSKLSNCDITRSSSGMLSRVSLNSSSCFLSAKVLPNYFKSTFWTFTVLGFISSIKSNDFLLRETKDWEVISRVLAGVKRWWFK
jgi:hypothetical protein